ncbi:hypothetical protein Agub_g15649, partial [Astrephomene gubernaculifera]
QGRVEVYYQGKWGAVCNNRWTVTEAEVVCAQLGFGAAGATPATFGTAPAGMPVWLDGVDCSQYDTEATLANCKSYGMGLATCDGNNAVAGVKCKHPQPPSSPPPRPPSTPPPPPTLPSECAGFEQRLLKLQDIFGQLQPSAVRNRRSLIGSLQAETSPSVMTATTLADLLEAAKNSRRTLQQQQSGSSSSSTSENPPPSEDAHPPDSSNTPTSPPPLSIRRSPPPTLAKSPSPPAKQPPPPTPPPPLKVASPSPPPPSTSSSPPPSPSDDEASWAPYWLAKYGLARTDIPH